MKKYLLFAAAFLAMTANAQEAGQVIDDLSTVGTAGTYTDKNGNEKETTLIEAGTVIAESANANMAVACDAPAGYKTTSLSGTDDPFNAFYGGADASVTLTSKGITGNNDNPKDADGNNPATSLKEPATGAAYKIHPAKNGYVYVFHKATANKNYFVFEEGTAIGYTFGVYTGGAVYSYQIKGDVDNGLVGADESNEVHEAILTPKDYIADYATGNAPSVIEFAVTADCDYVVGAGGSKMSTCGYIFSETKIPVGILGTDDKAGFQVALLNGDPNAINEIAADKANANAPIYNLAGQQVSKAYKGVVMQNGKKFIQK